MDITLKNIIPIPLKENLENRPSEVWHTEIHFTPADKVKIKAPSGTGKTTLVHFLYGLRCDYLGDLQWDGKSQMGLCSDKVAGYRQKEMSVVFQDLRLFAHLTARENIELNRVLHNQPYYPSSVIDQMAAELHVGHILDQEAGICSYGEQQRIAIIRALIQPFSILVMDEPFSHLDRANAQRAAAMIEKECDKRGAGFILTDLDEDTYFNYSIYLNL